jgi:phosphoribosylanthranilate isomerase
LSRHPSPYELEVPVKVKICGVRTPVIIEEAGKAGADFIGLVLFPKSPRHLELEEARVLAVIARGKIGTVAVLVDPDDELIRGVAERVRPDLIQLHGNETPARVTAIKAMTGLPVMKAIPVAEAADVRRAGDYAGSADYILFDSKSSPDASLAGGNGVPFDWQALAGVKPPFALSGGLTAETVGEAIRVTGATLVDVSSGVERARGEKDAKLVASFIRAAKQASEQPRAKAS